jgi:glycosyltransferase involved in cell wall biosynthesis
LQAQVDAMQRDGDVELLVFLDNRQRTIGEKRDALVQMSRGEFVAFVDDDDDVADEYVAALVGAAERSSAEVSVITFDQRASVNGVEAICSFSLRHRNEPFAQPSFKRSAWHVCAWRGDMARRVRFPATNYGEDWGWAKHLVIEASGEYHIDRVLHAYRYDERVSEAPAP